MKLFSVGLGSTSDRSFRSRSLNPSTVADLACGHQSDAVYFGAAYGNLLVDRHHECRHAEEAARSRRTDNGDAVLVANISASVGAFALADSSKDAVIIATLPAGGYTVQISGVGGNTGAVLLEVYEVP